MWYKLLAQQLRRIRYEGNSKWARTNFRAGSAIEVDAEEKPSPAESAKESLPKETIS
jgi:hypothetical protein